MDLGRAGPHGPEQQRDGNSRASATSKATRPNSHTNRDESSCGDEIAPCGMVHVPPCGDRVRGPSFSAAAMSRFNSAMSAAESATWSRTR